MSELNGSRGLNRWSWAGLCRNSAFTLYTGLVCYTAIYGTGDILLGAFPTGLIPAFIFWVGGGVAKRGAADIL